jgi:hypothetical protein
MKRMFILVAIALLTVCAVFAEETVLIDFTKLAADSEPNQDNVMTQNQRTVMDYSQAAGATFTAEQRAVMRTSLAMGNWDVVLAPSSRTIANQVNSYTLEAPSKKYGPVMGVRVHFPVESFNSWARIQPPFEIPAFETLQNSAFTRFEEGFGVVKNVGVLKSVAVTVHGLNFPHSLTAILINADGEEIPVFMGYLNFDGWGELRWDNPAYVTEIRNRELRLFPLYPKSTPFVKFGGFLVQKDASIEGGDFIAYFKDVKVIYDKAVLDTERDIENEGLWNIVQDREAARKNLEMERFGSVQVLRYLEGQKQADETAFKPSPEAAATK